MTKINREFFNRNTIIVAKDLLGKHLVHISHGKKQIGRIVEVEAYIGTHDLACHAARGKTKRTAILFGPPGHAYVYLIYGMYYCMNIVTEPEGHASAVLLRALEPVKNVIQRSQGPGLLCNAMHITTQLNAIDLTRHKYFYLENTNDTDFEIIEKPRIGVDYAGEWKDKLLRFYIKDNKFISRK